MANQFILNPVGVVRSPLVSTSEAPLQGDEGAPEAWLDIDPALADGIRGVAPGDEMFLLTWLHESRRDVLAVRPRGDAAAPLTGVFATRSPHRPNPIGLHRVRVLEIAATSVRVAPLEAIAGTPIVDLKPVLGAPSER